MKRIQWLITFLVSILLLSNSVSVAAQKRLIVKPDYTGTAVDTFATIKLAVAAAGTVSGVADTVIVYEGTYKEKVTFNKNIPPYNRKLVLASQFLLDGDVSHIEKTIISGGGITQSSVNDILFGAYGDNRDSTWIKFTGFTVDSASKYALDIDGGVVANCIFKNSGSTGSIPFYFRGTQVRNLTVYNNIGLAVVYFQPVGSDNNSAKFSLSASTFYSNKALGSNSERDDRGGPWSQNLGGIVGSSENSKGKIYNNIFYKNGGDQIIVLGGSKPKDSIDVYNNTFYKNNTKTVFFMNYWGSNGQMNFTTRWYNNIIDNNYTLATNNTNGEFAWGNGSSSAPPGDYYLKNNLLANEINTTKNQSSNFNSSLSFNYDTASQIIGSAIIKDTANLDFSLMPTSPGIGAGNSVFTLTTDNKGNTRPSPTGSKIDIGAVESLLSMPTPTITSLQKAVIGGKSAIKINFKIYSNPTVDSVIIYRSTVSNDTAIILSAAGTYSVTNRKDTLANKTTVFADTSNIVAATKYYYTIKAFVRNGVLKSEASKVDSITTNASASRVSVPANVTVNKSLRATLEITWTSANTYTGTYSATRSNYYIDIYRGTTSTNASLLTSIKDTSNSYTDKTTSLATTYYYYLVNRDANGVVSDSSANKSQQTNLTITAQRYHVDNVNGNDANGGTFALPFKTLTFALTQAIKGDTLIALPGTYNEKIKINPGVTFGSRFLITGDTSFIRNTILDAAGLNATMISYSTYDNGGRSIWTQFIGLTLTNAASKGKMLMNTQSQWQKYVAFDHCLFTNNGYTEIKYIDGRDANQDFIFIQFQDSTKIQNSVFEYNSGKIRMDGVGMQVTNNIFRNNNTNITRVNGNVGYWAGIGVLEGWLSGFTLSGNIFANNGLTLNNDNWQYYIINIGGNINDSMFITNNTFINNKSSLFNFNNQTPNTHITNNIFYNNLMNFYPNNVSSDFYVKNNAATSDISTSKLANLGSIVFSNNQVISKNIFNDSTLYTLDPSSDLINSGTNTFGTKGTKSVPALDLYGNTRPGPASSNSDIGAVESPFGFAAPILSSLDGANKSIVIKWKKPSNGIITGYEVFRSTSTIPSTASSPTFTVAKADSLILTDTSVVNLTKYYYRVRAYNGTGTVSYSAFSNELSVKPNIPPSNVDTVLAYAGTRSVALVWADTSTVRRKYNVYRGLDAANLDKIASAVDTTFYIDQSATAFTKYFYGIKVIDSVGAASPMSKLAYATANNIWILDTSGKSSGNGSTAKPYKSIQYAIDNANIGDTILLNNGTYSENLKVINKVVTIMAKNKTKAIITPLDDIGTSILEVQDQNPWGSSPYPKAINKFIGLVFTGSNYTRWNDPPAAINIKYNSNPMFESCIFTNNNSQFVFHFDQSAPLFVNCLVINNNSTNGVFALNGGQDSSRPKTKVAKFINSVISNNTFISRWNTQREKTLVLYNSILSENGYDNGFNEKLFRVENSIVDNQQLLAQSSTNVFTDPQFNNTSNGDYSLSNFSPALGAGGSRLLLVGSNELDTLNATTYDFNYASRPNPTGTKADLGAFENKYSIAAPQISRLQKSGTAITLTWAKTGSTSLSDVQIYRDTVKTTLDTIAPLATIVDLTSTTIADVLPSSTKEYFYAIRATIGTGANAIKTGLSNIKSSKDTIFVPAINFIFDTASIKIRAASRQGSGLGQAVNLVKLAADGETALPKLIVYSQEFRQIDSTKRYANDSLTAINILAGSGLNKIKMTLNKKVLIAKGKNDFMQLVSAMNVNGDDEFDLVGIYRNSTSLNQQARIAYLTNNNLNLTLDTVNPSANFYNPNTNSNNQTTNLSYKWDQKTFQFNDGATSFGQNIEAAAEFMDGNFDGKEELIVTLQQVKWEPNPTLNYGNYTSIYQTSSSLRPVKFVDINNDGIPDIFAMTNWPWAVGLGQTNGNPLVVFVSNKKDGKFYMYVTGINVDWGANLYFGDFKNSRTTQILTRVNGGNYKVYDFDKNYSAISAEMQVNGVLNDGKLTVGDLNNDGYPDVVTIDNSNKFIAYLNNHRGDFEKRIIAQMPFQSNASWSAFNLRMMDLNQDGAKDLMWFEGVPESDGSYNWNSNNFYVRTWLQEVGDQKRVAPTKISSSDIKVSNNGYNVKVQWTPSKDLIDPYLFANVKVDTIDTYKAARINNAYNYRQGNPAIPIVLDRVYARNYPDSLTFNDVNLSSKKPYYVKVQMVNQEGQASDFAEKIFSPKDPLASIDNAIPGLQNARFAWGDYNNDGLLDLAVMGQSDNGNVTKIYQNTGAAFVDLNLTNKAYRYGDIKWVDLNNDGWLDVAMIGQPGAGVGFQVLINNKGVFEVKTPASVAGLKYANMAFGDYDNNGTLDMFTSGQDITGNAHSYLYKNDGLGNFTIVTELNDFGIIPNLYDADARFVDYDLDGDLDLIYSGTDAGGSPRGGVRVNTILDPKLSTNNYGNASINNGYTYSLSTYNTDCQCNLDLAMKQARFDIGDIDGDGDLDIVEIGLARKNSGATFTDVPQLIIIRNQTKEAKNAKFGNYFSYGSIYNISATILDSIYNGDVKLVDFNNDGLLDITVTGLDKVDNPVTRFYLNQGGFGNFTLSNNAMIPQYSKSAISWGDANGDGSMDLVISGNKLVGSSTSIFINDQGTNTNAAPSVPQNLTFIDQGQGRVLLQWDASTDDHTNPDNLYYNLKLGTKPGLSDLRVIQVNPTNDKLLTPNTSLIGSTKYYIELPPGAYYWSVQAVDGNYSSSKFASNQKIVLKYPWQFVNQGGIVDSRIQPLENPAFAWADVSNSGVFDFLYLGTGNATNDQNNTPVGLYRNIGAKFVKLKNDSTQISGGFKGTGFRTDLSGIKNAQIRWVDLDNDGKLDLVVAGDDNSGKGRLVAFKNRGNYKFENITSSLFNGTTYLASPKIEFIDLDNNGLKDFIYTGVDDQGLGQFKFIGLYKDTVTKTPSGDLLGYKATALKNNLDVLLTGSGISNVNLSVGDLNKDLKPDFAILYDDDNGRRKGEVYMNTSDTSNNINFIKSATISLPTLSNSTLDLIDYNNDGLLDLALSGTSQATGQIFRIYQNKWLDSAAKTIQFVQSNSTVLPFESGQTTWGDINSDGYPDIIFSGSRAGKGKISAMALADPSTIKINGILKYNELPTFPFGDYSIMRPSLGDFTGKKVLDLVLVGTEKVTDPIAKTSSNVSSFKILKNVRALSALVKDSTTAVVSIGASTGNIKSMSTSLAINTTKENAMVSNSVRGLADSTIAVADSNYVEKSYGSNNSPTSPKIDSSVIVSRVDSVNNKYLVRLNWKAASDDNTPSTGLTYAVSIGTKPGLSDVVDPNASLVTGTRKTPEMGNAGKNLSITEILAPGVYYWSVQAIDASNAGSKFSGTKIIQVNANRSLVERSAPYDILLNTSAEASYFLKQNDTTGVKYALTALDNDSTAKLTYSIATDTASLFNIDAINVLRLKKKPTAAFYSLKLRVTDNYGIYFDKIYTFQVIQAPSKLLVNGKDTSYFYYNKTTADSAKVTLQLNATYDPVPAIDPVITYKFVTGVGGDNNGLFDLGSSILINKRKLNEADTIKLRVAATDVYGLSVERIIYLINTACITKPSITVKPSATACLPLVVNLTDTLITNGTAKGLTFGYYSDIDATTKVLDPTQVATSGTYYIKAFDTAGCGIAKPIVVNVANKPAAPSVTAAAACQNQSGVTIGYTAPSAKVKLVWYGSNATGGTPSTATPSFNTSAVTTLTYYVGQADTVAGCYSDRVKLDILVKPTPAAPSIRRDTAGTLVSSVATNVKWYKDTTMVSTAASFKPAGAGSYTVKTTDNGCTSVASNAYYFLVTDVINLSATEYIKLAPNPFVNFLNFDFVVNGYQKLNIDVFETSTGNRISSKQGVYAGSRLSYAELSAGVYIFKVSSSDGKLSYQFKMIKL